MTDEKSLELIQSLHRRTLQNKVAWVAGTNDRTFTTSFGDFKLEIQMTPDRDYQDEPDYAVVIRDANGSEIETISNVTLRPMMDRTTAEGLSPYAVLEETFKVARRKALGFDKALDLILSELKK